MAKMKMNLAIEITINVNEGVDASEIASEIVSEVVSELDYYSNSDASIIKTEITDQSIRDAK